MRTIQVEPTLAHLTDRKRLEGNMEHRQVDVFKKTDTGGDFVALFYFHLFQIFNA